MAHVSLGSISSFKVSVFRITATSTTNRPLEFFYKTGRLPPGLSIDPSGEVFGVLSSNHFDLDAGITTFDSSTTTFDKKYLFTVRAQTKDGPVTSTHDYSITTRKITTNEITNVYARLQPDKETYKTYTRFIADTKIFPVESLYRMSDKNFRTGDREVLVLAGLESVDLTDLNNAFDNNFYNLKLIVGDYKVGKYKDPNGKTLYEIVYVELIDLYDTASNTSQTKTKGPVYINSIQNMRNSLKNDFTVNDFEYLPHWMKSTQDNQIVYGYKLVLPLRYVLPGEGGKVLYKLKNEQSFDLKRMFFQIDRLYADRHTGTTIDGTRTQITAIGDGSTTTFVLPQTITEPKHLQILVDGVGVNTHDNSGNPLYDVDTIDDSTLQDSATVDSTALTKSIVRFTSTYGAPADGAVIKFQRKPTTFGLREFATFDRPNESIPAITADSIEISADVTIYETSYLPTVETVFDGGGTRFHTQPFTLDQKQPEDTPLLFARENVMDGINNTSKHRDLVRKAI